MTRIVRTPRRCCATVAAAVLLSTSLAAQVGHDPATSPYRDLRYGQFLSGTAGYMFGGGGQLGIGPHGGRVFTLRHDFLADRPLTIGLAAGHAQLDRNYANLQATADPRVLGPVQHRVMFGEGVLQLNFTGGKTWNGLAPYMSAGLGLAFAKRVPEDSSGYSFGTKFYFAPAVGVRVFVSRRLFVRLEARTMFWNLGYPSSYLTEDPDGFGPLEPVLAGGRRKEWSPVPMLHAGLGYAFRRPFF
jgi:opacity protein-like surface antigen